MTHPPHLQSSNPPNFWTLRFNDKGEEWRLRFLDVDETYAARRGLPNAFVGSSAANGNMENKRYRSGPDSDLFIEGMTQKSGKG